MMRGEGPIVAEALIEVKAPDGRTTTIKPAMRVESGAPSASEPIALPGGATATLAQIDVANQLAVVQITGVDLSKVDPEALKARAFVEVSYEPGDPAGMGRHHRRRLRRHAGAAPPLAGSAA